MRLLPISNISASADAVSASVATSLLPWQSKHFCGHADSAPLQWTDRVNPAVGLN